MHYPTAFLVEHGKIFSFIRVAGIKIPIFSTTVEASPLVKKQTNWLPTQSEADFQ
jgi:hypothetical protein